MHVHQDQVLLAKYVAVVSKVTTEPYVHCSTRGMDASESRSLDLTRKCRGLLLVFGGWLAGWVSVDRRGREGGCLGFNSDDL